MDGNIHDTREAGNVNGGNVRFSWNGVVGRVYSASNTITSG